MGRTPRGPPPPAAVVTGRSQGRRPQAWLPGFRIWAKNDQALDRRSGASGPQREGPEGKKKEADLVAILEAGGREPVMFCQDAFGSKRGTVGAFGLADRHWWGVDRGGCFSRRGLWFAGPAFSPLPNSGEEIVALHKTLQVRAPFPQLGENASSETGASACANPCRAVHLFRG